MDHSDKIQMIMDFADGTLDPGKEDQLFLLLSSDEELRQMFKSHINIKNSIHSGAGKIAVPSASKAAVFSALSLDMPASVPANSNRKIYITAGASILMTALVFLFLINTPQDKPTAPLKNQSVTTVEKNSNTNIPNIVAKETSGKKSTTSNKLKNKLVVNTTSTNIPAAAQKTSDDKTNSTAADENQDLTLLNTSDLVNNNNSSHLDLKTNTAYSEFQPITSNYNPMSRGINLNTNNKFSIEFRGSSYHSTEPPTISPKEYSPLNNMALALNYNFDKNFSAGVEVRQETFFLRYTGTQDNKEFIYEQQPNFTTFSATTTYKFDGWGGLHPFAQISAGINNVGFVSRAMLGAEYNIYANFSFMLGVDFNNFTYSYQNNYFNSSKFGLNYGLIYSF